MNAIDYAIDGTLERLMAGVLSIPMFLLFVVVAIGAFWYFGEKA